MTQKHGTIEVPGPKGVTEYLESHGFKHADVEESSSVKDNQIKALLEKHLFDITFFVGDKAALYITKMVRVD